MRKHITKKYIKKIVGCLLIGTMLFCGCQDDQNGNDKEVISGQVTPGADEQLPQTGENTSNTGTENNENSGDDSQSEDNSQLGTDDTQTDDTNKDDTDIQIPNKEDLIADYTSIEGLQLDAGSHIAVVVKSTEIEYWDAVKDGMQQAIDEINNALGYKGNDKIYMTYESPKVENSVDEQVNILDAIVSENPDVICLAAIDMNSCMAQMEAASQNGIPVIVLDSGVAQEDLVYSNCSTDNQAAGKEAAIRLCESIGNVGQIAVLAHLQLSETSVSRLEGFVTEIETNHPEVEIVNISYEQADDLELLKRQMEAVLTLYPDLKAYFCTNQVVSEVALEVLEQQKYEDLQISLVGFDMGKKQMEAIRLGKQTGTVCQNPYGMGFATVVAGARAAMGLENDKFIDAGFAWLNQETIDLEENARYLYE